jgi:Raf kinase inhibitor-like YbhB/YbcL family protein
MALRITSPAFSANAEIPRQFTRDAANVSPPIEWRDAPSETRSFALVVEDPDAPSGMFRHWAVYDIPEGSTSLDQGAGSQGQTVALRMGENDFGNTRYDGPQPPPGTGTHHYHFRLLALRVPKLDVPAQCSAKDVRGSRASAVSHGRRLGRDVREARCRHAKDQGTRAGPAAHRRCGQDRKNRVCERIGPGYSPRRQME